MESDRLMDVKLGRATHENYISMDSIPSTSTTLDSLNLHWIIEYETKFGSQFEKILNLAPTTETCNAI